MKKSLLTLVTLLCSACSITENVSSSSKLKALIIDGQNNHTVWPKSTVMIKQYIEESGLFEVTVYRTKPTWKKSPHVNYYKLYNDGSNVGVNKPETAPHFAPNFSD